MKFVKANLLLVILAAVAVLAVASYFYPFGVWSDGLAGTIKADYTSRSSAIKKVTNTEINIPTYVKNNAGKWEDKIITAKGIPTPNYVEAKKTAAKMLREQADKVVDLAARANERGRVEKDKAGKYTPLLLAMKMEKDKPVLVSGKLVLSFEKVIGFLPKNDRNLHDPMMFKDRYDNAINAMTYMLVGSDTPGIPPTTESLNLMYMVIKERKAAASPPGYTGINMGVNDQLEQANFNRGEIIKRAGTVHMYVNSDALQVRPWLDGPDPPTEQQMFEALVDCWFQTDVVMAIDALNSKALDAQKDTTFKNVGAVPVKRLIKVTVGAGTTMAGGTTRIPTSTSGATQGGGNPTTDAGQLFYLPVAAAGAPVDAAASAVPGGGNLAAGDNTIDPLRSLTGRASGKDYDVVLMQINMDIDPAYLNAFIDNLYKKNMGYTVLSLRTRTVDPLDRISNGFLFGESQVVEVEMVVEGLLFRNWSTHIMPAAVLTMLGATPPEQPAQQDPQQGPPLQVQP